MVARNRMETVYLVRKKTRKCLRAMERWRHVKETPASRSNEAGTRELARELGGDGNTGLKSMGRKFLSWE